MTIVMNLPASIQAVTAKIRPLHGTDKFDRLSGYIKSRTGGVNLAAYLGGSASDEDKINLNDEIIAVIDGNKWAELPAPPAGQAAVAAPVAAPVAAAPVAAAPVAAPARPEVAKPAVVEAPVVPATDPMTAAIVAAVLPHLKAASIDSNLVRTIVRDEIAIIFSAIAKGIK